MSDVETCFSPATFYVPVSGRNLPLRLPAPLFSFFFFFFKFCLCLLVYPLGFQLFSFPFLFFSKWERKREDVNESGEKMKIFKILSLSETLVFV